MTRCDDSSSSSSNAVNRLLDAFGASNSSDCFGVAKRLLSSSLGAAPPPTATAIKRDLIQAYQSFLLLSEKSNINNNNLLLLGDNKVKRLESLIVRLEDALARQTQTAVTSVTATAAPLSALIVLTRLIGIHNSAITANNNNNNNSHVAKVEPYTARNLNRKQRQHDQPHLANNQNTTVKLHSTLKREETTATTNNSSNMHHQQQPSLSSSYEEHTKLVRECIYVLQGIDGSRIQFHKQDDNDPSSKTSGAALDICPRLKHDITSTITLQQHLPLVTLDAIQQCGECGWLFLRIQQFINHNIGTTTSTTNTNTTSGRMVARALAEALSDEITEYHLFIANILEHFTTITLNQLVLTMRKAKIKLHSLALLVEECNKKNKYPAHHYASVVHIHAKLLMASSSSNSSSSSTALLFNKIASRTCLPIYQKMFQWVFYGILLQKQQNQQTNNTEIGEEAEDFFIVENVSVQDAHLWWENNNEIASNKKTQGNKQQPLIPPRYYLIKLMIPIFIPFEIAQMMFNIGKGVNFVRKCLGDKAWDLMSQLLLQQQQQEDDPTTNTTTNNYQSEAGFCYGYGESLQKTLIQCQTIVHSHILMMLFERYSLHQHLLLMKKCLLLSQGDFVQTLFESLDDTVTAKNVMDNPNNKDDSAAAAMLTLPPRYALQILVDNALHNTNYFKSLPDSFLSRIVVVVASSSTTTTTSNISSNNSCTSSLDDEEKRGLFKWDDFSLQYAIDAPLTSVIHPVAHAKYQLMFRLIWRCKHIEYMLSKTWRSAVTVHRTVLKMCKEEEQQQHQQQRHAASGRSARTVLRRTAMTRQKAMHFFSNFLSYISYEVLENSWKELQLNLDNAKTLDDIVRSHDLYMENMVIKSMLLAATNKENDNSNDENSEAEEQSSLATHLSSVLNAAARFTAAEERIFTTAVNGLEKASRMRRAAENRLKENKWGYEKTPSLDDALEAAFSDVNAMVLDLVISAADELDATLKKFITKLFQQTDDCENEEDDDYSHNPIAAATPDEAATPSRHTYFVERSIAYDQGLKDSLQFLAFRLDFNQYYAKECRT